MRRIIDSRRLPIENWPDWVVVGSHNTHNGKTHGCVLSGGQLTTIDVSTLTNATGLTRKAKSSESTERLMGRFHGFLLKYGFLA